METNVFRLLDAALCYSFRCILDSNYTVAFGGLFSGEGGDKVGLD